MTTRPSHCCVAHPDHQAFPARTDETDAMAARVSRASPESRAHWVHVAWMVCLVSRALKGRLACRAIKGRPVKRAIAAILAHLV